MSSETRLQELGQKLIEAAYDYWKEYQKVHESRAVVWLEDTSGHFILFTRSEYKSKILENVFSLDHRPPLDHPFEIVDETTGDSAND